MEIISLPAEVTSLLPALDIRREDVRRVQRMAGGLSGSRLYRIWLRDPHAAGHELTRVLKYAEPREGWLGAVSDDAHIREAQLAAPGLLAELPRDIASPIRAVAFHGSPHAPAGAALLMRDEERSLLPNPYAVPPGHIPRDAEALLDRLARMHAHFWTDPRLGNPALGLMSQERALRITGPEGIGERLALGDMLSYLPLAQESWDLFFTFAGEDAAQRFLAIMAEPQRILSTLERLPRTLVHGDIWGPNLGWLPTRERHRRRRLLLLDWALALAGSATYDPLWLCSIWLPTDPTPLLASYRARLTRALSHRGITLDGATWLALADAGYLRTMLNCGEGMARMALTAPAGAVREAMVTRLRWWIARALRAAERLEQNGSLAEKSGIAEASCQ